MSTYMSERAARGAAALDRIDPAWFKDVRLVNFDISCSGACVLGQLYGNMYSKHTPLHLIEKADSFGFDLKHRSKKNWAKLQEAWLREIKARWRRDREMIQKALDVCLGDGGIGLLEQAIRNGKVGEVTAAA